jgi:hypothetical protein
LDNNSTPPPFINFPKIVPDLKNFNFHFDLDLTPLNLNTQVHTPNPISILEQAQKQWQERDLKRELKIKKQFKEIDNDNKLSDRQKQAIKRLVSKTDGRYKLETVRKYVCEIENICKKEIIDLWGAKAKEDPVFWCRKRDGRHIEPEQIFYTKTNKKIIIPAREILDDDYGKNKERNDTIENIKDKYIRKSSKHSTEHLGDWVYKNDEAYRNFLKEVEAHAKSAEKIKSTVQVTPLAYYSKYMSNRYQEDEL